MNEDDEKTEIVTYSSCDPNLEEPILRLIETALEVDCYENLMKNYCKDTSILHFVFCCDVPVEQSVTGKPTGGILTQCLSTPLLYPFNKISSKKCLWSIYQRLSLWLRLGCTSIYVTMDALNEVIDERNSEGSSSTDFPATNLHETAPPPDRLVYTLDGDLLFFVLSGEACHLYATLPGSTPKVDAIKLCKELLTYFLNDKSKLFITHPLAF